MLGPALRGIVVVEPRAGFRRRADGRGEITEHRDGRSAVGVHASAAADRVAIAVGAIAVHLRREQVHLCRSAIGRDAAAIGRRLIVGDGVARIHGQKSTVVHENAAAHNGPIAFQPCGAGGKTVPVLTFSCAWPEPAT